MEIILPIHTRYASYDNAHWVFTPAQNYGWHLTVFAPEDDICPREAIMQVTKYVDSAHPTKTQIVIKDYSENEGIIECMVANKIITPANSEMSVITGFVNLHICTFTPEFLEKLIEAHPDYVDASVDVFKIQIAPTGEGVLIYNEDKSTMHQSHDLAIVNHVMNIFNIDPWQKTYVRSVTDNEGLPELNVHNVIPEDQWPDW